MIFSNSFLALVFLGLVASVLVLLMERTEVGNDIRNERKRDQETVQRASNLTIQSVSQRHPYYRLDHILTAKILLESLIEKYTTKRLVEQALKLEAGKITELQSNIDYQLGKVREEIVEKIIQIDPNVDIELNSMAGLTRSRKKKSSRDKSASRSRRRN